MVPSCPPRNPNQLGPHKAAAASGRRGRSPPVCSGSPLSPYSQGAISSWTAQLVILEVRGFWVPKNPGSLYSETKTPLFLTLPS